MADEWFYKSGKEEKGPLSFTAIQELVDDGELTFDDSIKAGTSGAWVSVRSIAGLFGQKSSPTNYDSSFVSEGSSEESRKAKKSSQPKSKADQDWYCRVLGNELGPLSFEEMKGLARKGDLSAFDQVRKGTEGWWLAARTVQGLIFAKRTAGETREVRKEAAQQAMTLDELDLDFVDVDETANQSDEPQLDIDALLPHLESAMAHTDEPSFEITEEKTSAELGSWYCQMMGMAFGPMSLENLRQMARQGELSSQDKIRHGEQGSWLSVETVVALKQEIDAVAAMVDERDFELSESAAAGPVLDEMFDQLESTPKAAALDEMFDQLEPASQTADDSSRDESSQSDADLLDAEESSKSTGPVDFDEDDVLRELAGSSDRDESADVPDSDRLSVERLDSKDAKQDFATATSRSASEAEILGNANADVVRRQARHDDEEADFEPREPLLPHIKEMVVSHAKAVAVIVIGLFILGIKFFPAANYDREYYDTLNGLWSEMKTLRDGSASDDEWSALVEKTETLSAPIVKDLNKTASANTPAKQELLWASKEHLPAMLNNARKKESESERDFERHMQAALIYIEGGKLEDIPMDSDEIPW